MCVGSCIGQIPSLRDLQWGMLEGGVPLFCSLSTLSTSDFPIEKGEPL